MRLSRSSIVITSGLNRKSGCRRKSPKRSRRRVSFRCVIANDEILVVEDLSRDRRFANNPLLRDRGLRFYAGVPLRSNNLPIGSLCILDIKPRRMSEREKRLLEVMAEDVMEEIKRRDSVGLPRVLVA